MAVQSDFILLAVAGAAVFGVSWYLGNKLEDLGGQIKGFGSGVIDTATAGAEAAGDFAAGATGQESTVNAPRRKANVTTSFDSPVFITVTPENQLENVAFIPVGGQSKVATSAPRPSPQREVITTKPDATNNYVFPVMTRSRTAGVRTKDVLLGKRKSEGLLGFGATGVNVFEKIGGLF